MRISDWSSDVCSSDLPAEHADDRVRDPLPGQLLVGIVPGSGHAIGNYRGQERLDRSKHGDREGRTEKVDHQVEADIGWAKRGESGEIGSAAGRERVCQDG